MVVFSSGLELGRVIFAWSFLAALFVAATLIKESVSQFSVYSCHKKSGNPTPEN